MKPKFTMILTLFMALITQLTIAQQKTISGTVSDGNGLPLAGATVVISETTTGTTTDFDGKYLIQASVGDLLNFSYTGYSEQTITIGTANTYNVRLQLNTDLKEVVVIAYGSQSKDKIIQNVSVISEQALENLVTTSSPDQLIRGQASGVQVVSTSGLLGSNVNIRVRGINTINSSSAPLFVVDGVVITDNTNTSFDGGLTGQNPLTFINSSDIESFSILKDAGATALYGARGANGVVLITTKKGKRNKGATVTLNQFVQTTTVVDLMEGLSPDEYRGFRTDIVNILYGVDILPEVLGLGTFGSGGSDFVDEISRTGLTKHTDFSVRGGSENTTYFMSAMHEDAESFAIGNDLTRTAVRVNLDHKFKKWLSLGTNIGVTNTVLNAVETEDSTAAPFTTAFFTNPTLRSRDENGNYIRSSNFIPNITALVNLNTNKTDVTRTIGNAYATINIIPELTFKTNFGVDRIISEQNKRSVDVISPGGTASLSVVTDNLHRLTNSLSYSNTFNKSHTVNALVLHEFEERRRRVTGISGTGFLSDDLLNVGSATTRIVDDGARSGSIISGFLGRLSYNYDNKYFVEMTGRLDESSKFSITNRQGRFWSLGAGWTVSNEKFFENINFINYLKLRATIGTAGNDRVDDNDFPYSELYGTGQFGGIPTANVVQPANPNLGWEETKTLDIGIVSSFFENRLNLTVTYFKKNTTDLLFQLPLPPQTGQLTLNKNVGELENKGWEFELSSTNIKNDNFEWSTSLNITTLKNTVIELDQSAAVDENGRRFIETGSQRAVEGLSLSNFYLVRYAGVNPQTGDAEWLDVNGDITTTPDFASDRVLVDQSALPDFTGGITNTFKYKNFDLSTVFNFSVGNSILADGLRFVDGIDAIGGIINVRRENLDFWRNPGDNAFAPSPASPTALNFNERSTAQLLKGDYLRLNNLTLGYTLPVSIMDKTSFLSNVRLYFTATNLLTFKGKDLDGIDPENNNSNNPLSQGVSFFTAPQAKTFLFGAMIKF